MAIVDVVRNERQSTDDEGQCGLSRRMALVVKGEGTAQRISDVGQGREEEVGARLVVCWLASVLVVVFGVE